MTIYIISFERLHYALSFIVQFGHDINVFFVIGSPDFREGLSFSLILRPMVHEVINFRCLKPNVFIGNTINYYMARGFIHVIPIQ